MVRRGFTVVELILVIAIMTILLTLSVVNLRSTQANGRDTERKADVESIAQHLEAFYTSGTDGSVVNGVYPSTALTNNSTSMKQMLRDIDTKSLTAPGVTDPAVTFKPATNNNQTTTAVLPQPSAANDVYVYQPLDSNGALCTASSQSSIEVLVVAGGGGGGAFAGGGGAGGLIYNPAVYVTPTAYTITVGAGGDGATIYDNGQPGINGSPSSFNSVSTLTAAGGGGGGTRNGTIGGAGAAGGSGGGGSPAINTTLGLGGAASPSGQGHAGGTEFTFGWGGSGGGGAGAAGTSGDGDIGGAGGIGIVNPITGSTAGQPVNGAYYLAGGGGGGSHTSAPRTGTIGTGGNGGGGAGGLASNGERGDDYTGGGGGGAGAGAGVTYIGGAGGSGIVIIRYLTGSLTATSETISISGAYTIHTFTSTGSSSFVVSNSNTTPECRKFNLYYYSEVDNSVKIIKSKNQ